MKGFITRVVMTACGAALLASAGGCYALHGCYDPCYPERYEYMARQEVNAASAPQIQNGHVLDQTLWNYEFEPGKDVLTPGGLDHLAYLARRRPQPDPVVYLQTAHDVSYDPALPEKYAEGRADLDTRRITAVQKYLNAETAGRHVDFQVVVHDPSDPGISANPVGISVQRMYASSQGVLAGVGGGIGGGGGGGGGAAGAGAAAVSGGR
jgi:hypothetical protein